MCKEESPKEGERGGDGKTWNMENENEDKRKLFLSINHFNGKFSEMNKRKEGKVSQKGHRTCAPSSLWERTFPKNCRKTSK